MIDTEPDPVAARAVAERKELVRLCAARALRLKSQGVPMDPHTLAWARQVVRTIKPLQGDLGAGEPQVSKCA